MKTLFIVAGHGLSSKTKKDPGATGPNYLTDVGTVTERSINLDVAEQLADRSERLGIKVYSIGVNQEMTLIDKINEVNRICREKGYDYTNSMLISIHCDYRLAPTGVANYYYGGSDESEQMGMRLMKAMVNKLGVPIRWNKPDTASRFGKLGIVRDTTPLATLIELGSLGKDLDYLVEDNTELVNGMMDFIQGEFKASEQSLPIANNTNTPSFKVKIVDLSKEIVTVSESWNTIEDIKVQLTAVQADLNKTNNSLRKL